MSSQLRFLVREPCNAIYYVPGLPMARVTSLQVEEGDKVQEGQVLAELDQGSQRDLHHFRGCAWPWL
jgi:hypothetical protein